MSRRELGRLCLACALAASALLLGACSTAPVTESAAIPAPAAAPAASAPEAAPADIDGPPRAAEIPSNLEQVPDAVPVVEPKTASGNPDRYTVLGQTYKVLGDARGYKQRGYASWYGRKFQGKRTSSGEAYDMFKMTAAHRTLPIPCYVRVTNLRNGRSVVVRVNDRGPFTKDRLIDLSYTAALKLAVLGGGSTPVEVALVDPKALRKPAIVLAAARPAPPAASPPAPALVAATAPANPLPESAPPVQVASASLPPLPVNVSTAEPLRIASMSATPPLSLNAPAPHFLQAGLFSDPVNAATMREQLYGLGIANVLLKTEARGAAFVHRVLIGPFTDSAALDLVRKRLGEVRMPVIPVLD